MGSCLAAVGLTLGVSACASFKAQPPSAVVSPEDVADRYRALYRVSHEDMSTKKLDLQAKIPEKVDDNKLFTPQQYAETGYSLAFDRCNNFFDLVTKASNELQMTKADVAALGTAAAAIIALVHQSSKPVGITAAAFGLGAAGFDNYQKYALLTTYPTQTHDLVLAAMKAYRTDSPPGDAKDIIEADARVSGYAQLCTYSSIVGLAGQAITTATVKVASSPPQSNIFTTDAELANVKKVQTALQLSDPPGADDLAVLAVMADSTTKNTDQPILAKMLSDAVAKKVWDAANNKKIDASFSSITQPLGDLKNNKDFSTLIAAKKALLNPASANGRPGDRNPIAAGVQGVPRVTQWQPPQIVINQSH